MSNGLFDEPVRGTLGGVGDRMQTLLGQLKRTKGVIPYTTYGYQKLGDEGTWVIPLRVWVNKARRLPIRDEVVIPFLSPPFPLPLLFPLSSSSYPLSSSSNLSRFSPFDPCAKDDWYSMRNRSAFC